MRIMLAIIILGVLGTMGFLAYTVRTATHDPAIWHQDPRTVPPSDTPNDYRIAIQALTEYPVNMEAPIYDINAATLALAFDEFVMGQPRVERVAGSPQEGWITYVQRTPQLLIPDYISVRFFDLEGENIGRSTIAIYSRSRYGYGDMGVNEKRAKAWLASLDSFVYDPATAPPPPEPAEGEAAGTEGAATAGEGAAAADGATPGGDDAAPVEDTTAPAGDGATPPEDGSAAGEGDAATETTETAPADGDAAEEEPVQQ